MVISQWSLLLKIKCRLVCYFILTWYLSIQEQAKQTKKNSDQDATIQKQAETIARLTKVKETWVKNQSVLKLYRWLHFILVLQLWLK